MKELNLKNFIYFIKDIYGGSGSCVVFIHDFEEYVKNKEEIFSKGRLFQEKRFIVQESIKQHEKMQQLNPQSVNTLRLVTTLDKYRKVQLLASVLRIGTIKSGAVDGLKAALLLELKKMVILKNMDTLNLNSVLKQKYTPIVKLSLKVFKFHIMIKQ